MDERTRKLQEVSSKVILQSFVDPRDDMKRERAKVTFDPWEMTKFLYTQKLAQKRRMCAKAVAEVPELKREDMVFMSGTELYQYSFQQFLALVKLAGKLGLRSPSEFFSLKKEFGMSLFPTDVHFSMFTNAMESQCSDEQRDHWMPQIFSGSIIGTYAQTELGHGTFLRGMETTATFDVERDEFIVHTPTDTATKWWPGGLGRTATHCVLYARLFINGQDYGPHAFVVQLRSLENHHPLPGIHLGDIGPKMGWHAIDNGFLKLDHVRIPRNQMLMRYAKVSRDGKYEKPPHAKFNYTTMVMVRTGMVEGSFETLGKAVTIAVRYSCVRRQGGSDPGEPEKQIIDYKTQQQMLFWHVSVAYAIFFAGRFLRKFFNSFARRTDDQDFSFLPELHATSAGLKALTTELAAEGAEHLRRYCGGHGFHKFSALPDLLNDHLPQVTGEGVNPVLYLQTARYLVRQVENLKNGVAIPSTLSYLSEAFKTGSHARCSAQSPADLLKPSTFQECFGHRTARLVFDAYNLVSEGQKQGLSLERAIERVSPDLMAAAKAHCTQFLLNSFMNITADASDPSLRKPLEQLLALFALGTIERELGDFTCDGFLTPQHCHWLKAHTRDLLDQIRPNALGLVDAFDFSDFSLNSSLGRYDGDCYRDMYRRAQREPRNQTVEGPAYEKGIKVFFNKSFL